MSSSRDSFMNALSMNGGDGEHSYGSNSRPQRIILSKTRPLVEENIKEMLLKLHFPDYIKVADLGCSSGPNTVLVMLHMVNTITNSYKTQTSYNLPEVDYSLSDLPQNDFNSTFKLIPSLNEKFKGMVFVSGTPGSFYSRLFPKKSLHFLHSSNSIHWLSKVPQGLEDNKCNVYIRSGCSLNVCKSYMNQFQDDFFSFLRFRSEEILPNGRMVLTFKGKKDLDPLATEGVYLSSWLSNALIDLVLEGVVKESEVDSFNLPVYNPNEQEVKEIVLNEGSFEIDKIETLEHRIAFKTDEDQEHGDDDYCDHSRGIEVGKKMANFARSITETMLVAHFGDTNNLIDRLFDKFAHHATQQFINFPNQTTVSIILSLIRKN